MNRIIAIFPQDDHTVREMLDRLPFEQYHQVASTHPNNQRPAILASAGTTIHTWYSNDHGIWICIWGIIAHPFVDGLRLPQWLANTLAKQQFEQLCDLIGSYVIFAHATATNAVCVITDVLGVRPVFLAHTGRGLVLSSHVWPLIDSRMVSKDVDYRSIASWIYFGFNCTDGTVFKSIKRVAPGSVVVFDRETIAQHRYAQFSVDELRISRDNIADEVHAIVSRNVSSLLNSFGSETSLALSGGYDSRYLLALAAEQSDVVPQCISAGLDPVEIEVTENVCELLSIPLHLETVDGDILDFCSDAFGETADGFPITKFVTAELARRYPAHPFINGYMGGLIRGFHDRIEGKREAEVGWKRKSSIALETLDFRYIDVCFPDQKKHY
ncbi:MAG: hypothetical protein MZV65_22330 [Chromatiales bacterium]|nr:hypothetical protein [Chromatiales bacterium]